MCPYYRDYPHCTYHSCDTHHLPTVVYDILLTVTLEVACVAVCFYWRKLILISSVEYPYQGRIQGFQRGVHNQRYTCITIQNTSCP